MLSEEEIENLIKKLKIYQKYKAPMLYHYEYIQHIIEVLEYIINPAIIKKDIKRDKVTAVDVIEQACKMVEDEQN